MFCPKCGTELPDGSQFCGSCGNQIGAASRPAAAPVANAAVPGTPQAAMPAPAPQAGQASFGTTTSGTASTARLIPLAGAILTAICMILPWLHVPAAATLGSYASMLGIEVKSNYSVFGLGKAASILDSLAGTSVMGVINVIVLIVWLVALVLIIAGAVMLYMGRGSGLLLAGAALAARLALIWCIAVFALNSTLSSEIGFDIRVLSVPVWPIATILLGIVTAFFAIKAA